MKRHTKQKKIAYITGTRADFGLMTPVLEAIAKKPNLKLQIYATGMHLMKEFGKTLNSVKQNFPKTTREISAIFDKDTNLGVAHFVAKFTNELTKTLTKDKPDFMLLLGDRPETLCTALVCLYLGIPTGHLHGGDKTLTDDTARHAITKLSSQHFPATQSAADRIKKLGEDSSRIHIVGAPALDVIMNKTLPSRKKLFTKLNLPVNKKFILVIQHPAEDKKSPEAQILETLVAVKTTKLPIVVIYPNADPGGRKMIKIINREKNNPEFHIYPNLEYHLFLALEREAAVIVGNSSSAIIESSSFHTPVVNIGTRELLRERAKNVIDVGYDRTEIAKAIKKSLSDQKYLRKLARIKNPWGQGKTGLTVANLLSKLEIDPRLLIKQITY